MFFHGCACFGDKSQVRRKGMNFKMNIEIINLKKIFKENIIFENVNMNIEKGKIYGLIGRNGSGKSVFLKTICGFIVPDEGKVIVNSKNIFDNNSFLPEARAMIEKPSFIDDISGLENLKILASIQNKINEEQILFWLKEVGLFEERNKKYSLYSLGMKQKLAIVQVLMENPSIMILDEPFNGLDKESYNKMIEIFLHEKLKGKTIIIATHIENDIDKLCDHIYEIDGGKINAIN